MRTPGRHGMECVLSVFINLNTCSGFHITRCPGQPFLPVGQPTNFAICLYIYVIGQPKCVVGQPQFGNIILTLRIFEDMPCLKNDISLISNFGLFCFNEMFLDNTT